MDCCVHEVNVAAEKMFEAQNNVSFVIKKINRVFSELSNIQNAIKQLETEYFEYLVNINNVSSFEFDKEEEIRAKLVRNFKELHDKYIQDVVIPLKHEFSDTVNAYYSELDKYQLRNYQKDWYRKIFDVLNQINQKFNSKISQKYF